MLVLSISLHLPGLLSGPTLDAAVFTTIADGLRAGELPYRDLWDHKPPGIYFLLAGAQALLWPLGPWGSAWTFSVLVTTGIGLATMSLARPLGPVGAAVAGTVTVTCISLYPLSLGGGNSEEPATLIALIAMLVAMGSRPARERGFVSGLLLGAAAIVSPQLASAAVGVSAVMILRARPGERLGSVAVMVPGLAAVPMLSIAWVVAAGVPVPAYAAVLQYNAAYAELNRGHLEEFMLGGGVLLLSGAPLVLLAVTGFFRPGRAVRGHLRIGLAIWLLVGAVTIAIQGRAAPHYAIGLIPPIVILATGAWWPRPSLRGTRLSVAWGLTLGVAITAAIVGVQALFAGTKGLDQSRQVGLVAGWLRNNAAPGAAIFVWGNNPFLYLDSGLRPASEFIYVLPLLTPGFAGEALVREVVQSVAATRPQYVIDAGSPEPGAPGIVPLLEPRPVDTRDGRTLDVVDPLRDLVRERYGSAVEVAGWLIYEIAPDARAGRLDHRSANKPPPHSRQAVALSARSPTRLR